MKSDPSSSHGAVLVVDTTPVPDSGNAPWPASRGAGQHAALVVELGEGGSHPSSGRGRGACRRGEGCPLAARVRGGVGGRSPPALASRWGATRPSRLCEAFAAEALAAGPRSWNSKQTLAPACRTASTPAPAPLDSTASTWPASVAGGWRTHGPPPVGTRDRRRSGVRRARSSTALDRCCTAMLGPVRPTAGVPNRQSRRLLSRRRCAVGPAAVAAGEPQAIRRGATRRSGGGSANLSLPDRSVSAAQPSW